MKMSDIFGYDYKMTYGVYTDARVNGMAMPANMGFGMLFTNEEAPKAVCHAVNNHDRLTEENKRLREFVKQVADGDTACTLLRQYMVHSYIHSAVRILEELEGGEDE